MTIAVEPVIGRSPLRIGLALQLRGRLQALAAGRPLVIDYYATRLHGVAVGDLTVTIDEPAPEPCFIELEPVEGVVVLAHRRLLQVLEGATLREAGPPWNRHLVIGLSKPEDWMDFLDRHGSGLSVAAARGAM